MSWATVWIPLWIADGIGEWATGEARQRAEQSARLLWGDGGAVARDDTVAAL